MKKCVTFFLLFFATISILGSEIPLSLSHLEDLRWDFKLNTSTVTAWWVYSKASFSSNKYRNVPAKNEGSVCVDDASRAVILYLQLYEGTKDRTYLRDAKGGLAFLMQMEESDGEFYNFVYENGEINKYGITSQKSVSWWTVRGFWALSMGSRIFKSIDPEYSAKLFDHAFMAYKAIKLALQNGLVQGYSDVSSVFLLGLSELQMIHPDPDVVKTAYEVANGILKTQSKSDLTDGAFFNSEKMDHWNGWGSRQVQALALAGRVFKVQKWIKSAEYAALHFYPKLIFSLGPIYSIGKSIKLYPQISYANEVMVSGLTELYLSTKKAIYAQMAYIAASWYFYNNHLGELMYTHDGKGYDGLEEFFRNIDSGAESTVCADLSLSDLMKLPRDFSTFLKWKRVFQSGILVLNASKMYAGFGGVNMVHDGSIASGAYALLSPYSTLSGNVTTNRDDDYDVYISYLNTSMNGKINLYVNDKRYEFQPTEKQRFEFVKVPFRVHFLKGKNRFVIEYVNQNSSAKIDVAQIVLVPHLIMQTLSVDEKHRLTSVFNTSNHYVNVNTIVNGKISRMYVYDDEGLISKSNMIPKNGVAFVKWISTAGITKNTSTSIKFENASVAATSGNFVMMALSQFFNNSGIVSIHSNVPANFDNPAGNAGAAYPLEFLIEEIKDGMFTSKVGEMQVPFYMKGLASGTKNNMTLQGQKIGVKRGKYKEMFLLGSADHGNYKKVAKIYYSDGSFEEVIIGFADWFLKPLPGEWTVFKAPYGLNSQMQKINGQPKLYVQQVKLDASKELIGIEFPNQITLHIFAITLLR